VAQSQAPPILTADAAKPIATEIQKDMSAPRTFSFGLMNNIPTFRDAPMTAPIDPHCGSGRLLAQ
jgi:hypothetical protein